MATKTHPDDDAMLEECPSCERETPHEVSVRILTESDKGENAEFSREPYRVAVCDACGAEEKTRMNNA
ncbi:hypothetical protein [Halorarius halobius]|uniref:DUF7835 family putative zinc beta-ribbon protein n=1 Tax=Halorarius halobius TaxID=2962671 RepID=UPI0020CB82D6|nr:hypothetical protein [Halorarius halobius]